MKKPGVFISHVGDDAQIAACLGRFLDDAFLGAFELFISSDGASIRAGDNWSAAIETALTNSKIVLAVITQAAKERRWIYFECGGAYFAGKRVIPVCCRGFSISDLPPPLSWLQAIDGRSASSVERLIEAVAHSFELRPPRCNAAELSGYLNGTPCAPVADKPTSREAAPGLPIFLLVDTSASMTGPPIENLSAAVRSLLHNLRTGTGTVAPLVSIIAFGSAAVEVLPLAPINDDMNDLAFQTEGSSSLGAAFHLLASRLDDRAHLPQAILKPIIVVMTNGHPTDDWRSGLMAVDQTRIGKHASKICVGIGESYDSEVLRSIAGDAVFFVRDPSSIAGISRFFVWMSKSVSTASTSTGVLTLPPLPPDLDFEA